MQPSRVQTRAIERFRCLGGDCPDTCCQGWGMQLAEANVEKYRREAPELLEVVVSGEAEFIMKRDPVTDRCVKLDAGICSIHRDYGEAFLGDACDFFPRITRAIGTTVHMSGALSCPESARLMLLDEDGLALTQRTEVRTPFTLKNYLAEGISEEAALDLHAFFVAMAGDASYTAEHNLMRVSAVVQALAMQPMAVWPEAAPMYGSMAEGRIPKAEPAPADPFNLLQALQGLVIASNTKNPRLVNRIAVVADALGVTFDAGSAMTLTDDALTRSLRMLAHTRAQSAALQTMLRRYVQAQLVQALFPFAGLGDKLSERIAIIGVRLATVKLLLSQLEVVPDPLVAVEIIQALSRVTDHLADAGLVLSAYREAGWLREPRLRALLGDD